MRTRLTLLTVLALIAGMAAATSRSQERPPERAPADGVPAIDKVEMPSTKAPEAPAASTQPRSVVYVGPEGSFLLAGDRSRGIFRWGAHWANSTRYNHEDANYWIYRLVGTNGWFAFAKNPSGGTYLIWKGLGPPTNITWQDQPHGWMRASRSPAQGNLD